MIVVGFFIFEIKEKTSVHFFFTHTLDGNSLVGFHPLYLAGNPPDNIDCPYTNSILVQKDWAGKILFTRIGAERISQVNAVWKIKGMRPFLKFLLIIPENGSENVLIVLTSYHPLIFHRKCVQWCKHLSNFQLTKFYVISNLVFPKVCQSKNFWKCARI